MSRIALLIGIGNYPSNPLPGCATDALALNPLLQRNDDTDKTFNFETRVLADQVKSGNALRSEIENFFRRSADIALFYFSGHGRFDQNNGSYLIAHNSRNNEPIMSMQELINLTQTKDISVKIIILDCCFSGNIGNYFTQLPVSMIAENTVILTSSRSNEFSAMNRDPEDGSVFTSLLLQALEGGASDLLGNISPSALYAFVDQALGNMEIQRPVFKANVHKPITIRRVKPLISTDHLMQIVKLFPTPDALISLDPSWEPTEPSAIKKNVEKLRILQKMNRVGLVVPVDEEHLYFAVINSKWCKLTALGKHYWNLADKNRF